MPSLLNRSDLLACLKAADDARLPKFAAVFGLQARVEPSSVVLESHEPAGENLTAYNAARIAAASIPAAPPQASFIRVEAYRRLSEEETAVEPPAWYSEAEAYAANDPELQAPTGLKAPRQAPLMPWSRLWPLLKRILATPVDSHAPDLPEAVRRVAQGECLKRLPKARRKHWAAQAQLILDYEPSLMPFMADFNGVRDRLEKLPGLDGLEMLAFPEGDPYRPCRRHGPGGWGGLQAYRLPPSATPILILGDAGCFDPGGQRRRRWLHFGRRLRSAGCRPVVLCPCPPGYWPAELCAVFDFVYWDRGVRPPQALRRQAGVSAAERAGVDPQSAEPLLALLATALRVEPALLRTARYLFPQAQMPAAAEYAAWNHPAVQATPLGFYFQAAEVVHFRDSMRAHPGLSLEQKQAVCRLQQAHHAPLSPVIAYEEQLAYAELMGETAPAAAQRYAARLAKSIGVAGGIQREGKSWLGRMGGRQHPGLWANPALAAAWLLAHADQDMERLDLPAGLSTEKLPWLFAARPPQVYHIMQRGEQLQFAAGQPAEGSLLGRLRAGRNLLEVERHVATGGSLGNELYALSQAISLDDYLPLWLRSDREEWRLDYLQKPAWATGIGRDSYGLFADIVVNGIGQRFRWLNPGEFLMGSPPEEAERLTKSETLHPVSLSRGFWLADTAVSQALWLAVMGGENPSYLKEDPNNPVEQVSWQDAQAFIAALNGKIPGLHACLPSEAQWEYACRAGTDTPFSFGDNITPELVNYNGEYPYAGGAKGLKRGKTVPVKTLPVNAWGLHEMHGNVWEWCQDAWQEDLGDAAVSDPLLESADRDSARVVRGGSWLYFGRGVRSAFRGRLRPAERNYGLGFRLSLGHVELRPVQAGGAEGIKPGRPAAVADCGVAEQPQSAMAAGLRQKRRRKK